LSNDWVTPNLTAYYDFDKVQGFYIVANIEHEFALISHKLSLTPGFSAGWGSAKYDDYHFGIKQNALNDGNVYVTAKYSVTKA